MDYATEILKNSIKFLFEASDAIPLQVPTLKSFYASKGQILGLQGSVRLPSTVTKWSVRCPRCCLSFTDYPPSVVLKPSEKSYRFLKKIQRKSENDEPHTLYQMKRAADVKNIDCNIITKICQNCKYETKTFTKKPTEEKIRNNAVTKSAKRKKKKKDKYCGLVEEAVISCSKKEQGSEEDKQLKNKISDISSALKKRKKKTQTPLQPKTTKDRIIERKQNKTNKKLIDNIKTLLNNSGKSNSVVGLKSFLQDL